MHNKRLINFLFLFGRLFAPLYSLAMTIRAKMYSCGLKSSYKLPIPVISVGNLTMGGTGKTPMVMYIVRLLARHNIRTAIISRGYGGKSKKPLNIVSKGQDVLMSAAEAGDEPVLLAHTLRVPVLTGPRRILTGQYIVKHQMADMLLMDDGYQHLALQRDLNIALFSGQELLGNGLVFPGGPLREPRTALKRSHCFVITGINTDQQDKIDSFCRKLRQTHPTTPLFQGSYKATVLTNTENKTRQLKSLGDMPLFAFCGIAQPNSFWSLLQSEGNFNIKAKHSFADHHPFTKNDVTKLIRKAQENGCQGLLTTEKDLVKLSPFKLPLPIWALRVELIMTHAFDQFILQNIEELIENPYFSTSPYIPPRNN